MFRPFYAIFVCAWMGHLCFSAMKQVKQLEISGLVIHKIDIGKVKTSKNVMKLLKLLLTVIVKHPVVEFTIQ